MSSSRSRSSGARGRRLKRLRMLAFKRQGGKCYYCKCDMVFASENWRPDNAVTSEHIIAVCDGGEDSAENVVAACYKCNHSRHAKSPTSAKRMRFIDGRVRWTKHLNDGTVVIITDEELEQAYARSIRTP